MITPGEIQRVLAGYARAELTVATVGSHTALQILKGARDEGFRNLAVCRRGTEQVYQQFGVADEILSVARYQDLMEPSFQQQLVARNAILIPHGSFVEYLSPRRIENELAVPQFGNRAVLEWESDRVKERAWLRKAGLTLPQEFRSPEDIDRLVLVKFPGAKGGRGYFMASSATEFEHKLENLNLSDKAQYTIQEFVIGTRFYPHYFYSPLQDRLELLSMDIRYETTIDGLARVGALVQDHLPEPSFVVTGNLPVVARESLLPAILKLGHDVVSASQELFSPGLIGPFCIETICTAELEFVAFEISARIVAGTNLYINGSPYSHLLYDEPMSTGRRIARELKDAVERDALDRVVY
ncbi:MAG TPA: formate--phosphoribosylaminoimidazolecarboxamide ligase [Methanomicrobia archaeon]|nr:formate--phosphoribosylaminoimidazolecarboxamide ligase [Methanomicrobia archaeon]